MTEQQKDLERRLFALIDESNGLVDVSFGGDGPEYRDRLTGAIRQRDRIWLCLIEPNDNHYYEWINAINRAFELLGELKKELIYNEQHPNFYRAIKAKVENKYRNCKART